ncbi:MAG: LysM peptidoglycan-binding domain-containing protein [Acidobacteriota bacterium]
MINRIGNIPSFQPAEPQGDQHLTQPGDTMAGVAQRYGVSAQDLAAANPFIANPNGLLPPGVYLNVPKRAETEAVGVKPREDEQERGQQQQDRDDDQPKERYSASNLETVTNNPVANSKRNYELARGELSLTAFSLANYDPGLTANPITTGKYTREHLLADDAFTNSNAMRAAEIQALFHEKGSGLATLLLPDGRSAAHFIAATAVARKVNPQVLIVLLQRDGGFIAGKYAQNIERERLDWAFGFGAEKVERLRGFDRQTDMAANRLRQLFDQNLSRMPSQVILDGRRQKVENAATLALYQLVPQETLVRLFYEIWQGFFGNNGLGRAK